VKVDALTLSKLYGILAIVATGCTAWTLYDLWQLDGCAVPLLKPEGARCGLQW
jgi:hypothetical protein